MAQYQSPQPNQALQQDIEKARGNLLKLYENMTSVIMGKDDVIKKLLIAIMANGHVLLYDVPGVGKTVLAKTLAKSINSTFKRVQFTPDLLPSDITGVNVYDPTEKKFEFMSGPIFTNILLADEINRTSPKTQASLLEAMEERQVSVDNVTYRLADFFFVIATQNPVEHDGTYPLPAAQLDRFLMRVEMGYPDKETEAQIVAQFAQNHPVNQVESVVDEIEVLNWQKLARQVYTAPEIANYCVELARTTRSHTGVNVGVSPRGAILLARAAKATALLNGRDYTIPDDVIFVIENVFAHRLSEAAQVGESVVREVVSKVSI
jgi:MoxR-like ATPase